MADPAKGEPTREEVFAYLDKRPGRTAADVCDYFAGKGREIQSAKVRVWMSRRRKANVAPGETWVSLRKPRKPKAEPANDSSGLEGFSAIHSATTGSLRAQGGKPPPLTKPIQRTAANLTEPARELLRRAVFQQLEFLSDPSTVPLQKDRADASRALTSLLLGCPDILTFEDRTSGKDRAVAENAEAAQLAAVFDVQAGS